jgi:uncharacterized protein (TIGR02391 family)
MEPRRIDFIPPPDEATALPTPELAVRLLAYLVALEDALGGHGIALGASQLRPDAVAHSESSPEHTKGQHDEPFLRAVSEAWAWLVANGLLARRPGTGSEDMFVTRAGRAVVVRPDGLARLRAQQRLGVELHQRIASKIRNQFLLGDHETAVFVAMKEVEIRVRELSGLDSLIGVKLMQEAFRPESPNAGKPGGPLANSDPDGGEQVGWMHLFCGAISVFKNPSSHRQVDFDEPTMAAEVILLGDLMLRLLDDVAERLHVTPQLNALGKGEAG